MNKYKDFIPHDAVYIGRGSPWGNPFPMQGKSDREKVLEQYKAFIKEEVKSGRVTLQQLALLYGKDLVCYCAPKPCHGYVLEKLAIWAYHKLQSIGVN